MTNTHTIDLIAERVEHLLLRHEELARTNDLLRQQVSALSQERDLLKSRLAAARARVDGLIDRLPASPASDTP
jgi:cell division protein ZapB